MYMDMCNLEFSLHIAVIYRMTNKNNNINRSSTSLKRLTHFLFAMATAIRSSTEMRKIDEKIEEQCSNIMMLLYTWLYGQGQHKQ